MLGPFHKSFTCIVGPNGSGKSNVIDSMLFVFGYRANKIRLKKISMLIHNSENHKNIDSCSVSVYFQKIIDKAGDDFEVVPNSEFVVSRTAFKDNSSFYTIDGRRVQFKEVAKLLRGSGIDLDHNRFLILQGEVEQIALMKPKAQTEHDEGMLEFLEDIIGSSRFKEPIEKLSKQVDELNEQRGEKLNRVKAVEKEKDMLQPARDEAVTYLKQENEIIRLKNKLYHKYIQDAQKNLEKAEAAFNEIKKEVDMMKSKMQELNKERGEKEKQYKKIEKNLLQINEKIEAFQEQFKQYDKQDTKNIEDIKHTKSKGKKLVSTLESEKKKLEELQTVPQTKEKEIVNLENKKEKLEKELAAAEENLQAVMASLRGETQQLQDQKDMNEKELIELQKAVNETQSNFEVAQSELDIYLSNQQSEQARLDEAKKTLQANLSTVTERKAQVGDLERKIPQAEKELCQKQQELTKVFQKEQNLSADLHDRRIKVEEYRNSMSASHNKNAVLDALMQQKQKGKILGVIGRLGDLGGIDDKYDAAISNACGSLDNIVVDTIDTAQKCVEFLKKHNVGRATFIALDKMQHWKQYMDQVPKTPENAPRLFDLINFKNNEVRPAFYFALRDTLVATDLTQGQKIAYGNKRWRVVTLAGAVIDISGTMTGGGQKVKKGGMGRSAQSDVDITSEQLKDLEQKLHHDMEEAEKLRQQKLDLEDRVEHLKNSITEMKHMLNKYKMDISALVELEVTLRDQVKEAEKAVKAATPDKATLAKLQQTVAANRKEYEKAAGKASKVEKEVQKLHNEIMEITGGRTRQAQTKVDATTANISQVDSNITKASVAIKTAKKNIKKSQEKVASTEAEIEENKSHFEELIALKAEVETNAEKCLLEKTEAEEKREELVATAHELKKELEDLDETAQQMDKDNVHIKDRVETYEHQMKESKGQMKHWQKMIGSFSLNVIDGEDEEAVRAEFTLEELDDMNREDLQHELTVKEELLQQMEPNMAAIAEYKKKEELYLKRVGELDRITELRDGRRKFHEDLRKQRLDEFMAGFSIITNKLKEMYQMITLGGDAELELVDSLDPFSEGIVFSVRPPKKSWKNISNLSGGEKTLSSLALVFALHHYKPTPLYVMDEIDAALDFKNVSIVGNYIKERTRNAQFIIISLRNNMFELADRLVGIYKTNDATKSVTINPGIICQPVNLSENTSVNMTTSTVCAS